MEPCQSRDAQVEKGLVSGTNLRPGVMTPLAIQDRVASNDGYMTSSKRRRRSRSGKDTGELLLEQAAQAEESRSSRRKKKSKGGDRVMEILRKAVGGKKKKKKKKKKGKKRREGRGVKKEPGDPDDSDGEDSDYSDSSSSSSFDDEESKSDLSYEPPLRKKALSSPGSVMEDLIRHAQEQMDRGAMLDQEGKKAGVTQGIKLSTYFALLIRPFYPTGNPLLRELYALAQSILVEDGKAGRDGRCLGEPIRGGPHGDERRELADGSSVGAFPAGASAEHKHQCDASSSKASAAAVEISGLHEPAIPKGKRRMVAIWPGRQRPRQGKRQGQERKRKVQDEGPRRWRQRRGQRVEGQQGRSAEEGVNENESFTRRIQRSNEVSFTDYGLKYFYDLAGRSSSLSQIGCALAWLVVNRSYEVERGDACKLFDQVVLGSWLNPFAMQRERSSNLRSPFPVPLGDVSQTYEKALRLSLEDFCLLSSEGHHAEEAWVISTVAALNGMAGKSRAVNPGQGNKLQRRALAEIRSSVKRMLVKDCELHRCPTVVEKELASRFITYTGEEVPKMQVLSVDQVLPALPPASHGGSIHAVDLVCEGTRRFLENPYESLRDNVVADRRVLQAKVHVAKGEESELSNLLVSRNICTWVAAEKVLTVGGCRILNGLFGVGKGKFLENGLEIQRVIMNLVPSNSVFEQARGYLDSLPSITQYLSLVLDGREEVSLHQSDMSSAFYLFAIPSSWSPCLCFNICRKGEDIGLVGGKIYYLACAVIPMGWSSAVSIMQEIADRLTTIGRLPQESKIRRNSPLPYWLVETLEKSRELQRAWFHVYLDNFCSMGKIEKGGVDEEGASFHNAIENAWESQGVLNSVNKRISNAGSATELGAELDGGTGTLGPSSERLIKLIQATLVVIGKRCLNHKWVQVIAGRWVHVLAFRRPGMVVLDCVWAFISRKKTSRAMEQSVRGELWHCCLLALLLHGDLRAPLSEVTTASDASSTGGAVGFSRELSQAGSDFCRIDRASHGLVPRIPVMVISLFNGIGCAFRCYDLVGVPEVALSFEISREANRVTSRRWPNVIIEKGVETFDEKMARDLRYKYPQVIAIHLWAGFPCIDLSSVKLGRLNLKGAGSGLFYELMRILKLLRRVFGFDFEIKYFVENVASMDVSAEQEISSLLGQKPFRVDSADCVPIHRPRFCWTNEKPLEMEGITITDGGRWFEISMKHPYPLTECWLEPGAVWDGEKTGTIFPTCMKSIERSRPPPAPAGYSRCSWDTLGRWEADSYRFPPYQYGDRFIIWKAGRWRLLSSSERELLHGLGWGHTELCWNAGDIKASPQKYEDVRKTLIGDSFNCFSFAYFAAMACQRWIPGINFHMIWSRGHPLIYGGTFESGFGLRSASR